MDLDTMNSELIEVRERLVRIEANLEHVQRSVEKKENNSGAVVIPVAAVVAAVEFLKVLIERVS